MVSDQWKEMGWQGRDPSTDFRFHFHLFLHCSAPKFSFSFFFHFVLAFSYVVSLDDLPDRGAGFISLENLLFFAKTFSVNSQT